MLYYILFIIVPFGLYHIYEHNKKLNKEKLDALVELSSLKDQNIFLHHTLAENRLPAGPEKLFMSQGYDTIVLKQLYYLQKSIYPFAVNELLKKEEIEILRSVLYKKFLAYGGYSVNGYTVEKIINSAYERNREKENVLLIEEEHEKLKSFHQQGFNEGSHATLYHFHNQNYPSEIIEWFNKDEIAYFLSKDGVNVNVELGDKLQELFDEKLNDHLFDADDHRDQEDFDL